MYTIDKELRDCFIAARDGNAAAARQVLRLYGYPGLAKQIRNGKEWPKNPRRYIDMIVAAVGTDWEEPQPDGTYFSTVFLAPPKPGEKGKRWFGGELGDD
jgi:hypothetical protein